MAARDELPEEPEPAFTWQARLGAQMMAREIELIERRNLIGAVRRPAHLDLLPAEDVVDPDSGRRRLAPDPTLVMIGRYLRRSRYYAQKTQRQVAAESGLSQSMVSRAERGVAPGMRFDRFVRLCLTLAAVFPFGACP